MPPPSKRRRITNPTTDNVNNRSRIRPLRDKKRVRYAEQQQNYRKSACLTLKAEKRKRKRARENNKKSTSVPELSPLPSDPCTLNQSPPKSQSLPQPQIIRNQQILPFISRWHCG